MSKRQRPPVCPVEEDAVGDDDEGSSTSSWVCWCAIVSAMRGSDDEQLFGQSREEGWASWEGVIESAGSKLVGAPCGGVHSHSQHRCSTPQPSPEIILDGGFRSRNGIKAFSRLYESIERRRSRFTKTGREAEGGVTRWGAAAKGVNSREDSRSEQKQRLRSRRAAWSSMTFVEKVLTSLVERS